MLSRQHDLPAPSSDLVGGPVYKGGAGQRLLQRIRHLTANVDSIFKIVSPRQYRRYRKAHEGMKLRNPHTRSAATFFDSAFTGLALIFNRRTPRHKDITGGEISWDGLWPIGDYQGGDLHFADLNFTSYYGPDTFVLLRGGKLAHEVLDWEGPLRISVVYFSHKEVFNYSS